MPTKTICVYFPTISDYEGYCDFLERQNQLRIVGKGIINAKQLNQARQSSIAGMMQPGSIVAEIEIDDPHDVAESAVYQFKGKLL